MWYIIIGLLALTTGGFLVIKTEWFLNNFGRIAWFEDKLGVEGGSRFGYKLVGLIFLIIGLIAITGNGESFMFWITSPFTRYTPK
ncbi:MAG: hypothetical protein WC863_00350 [Patescibacteria group bacterium]